MIRCQAYVTVSTLHEQSSLRNEARGPRCCRPLDVGIIVALPWSAAADFAPPLFMVGDTRGCVAASPNPFQSSYLLRVQQCHCEQDGQNSEKHTRHTIDTSESNRLHPSDRSTRRESAEHRHCTTRQDTFCRRLSSVSCSGEQQKVGN